MPLTVNKDRMVCFDTNFLIDLMEQDATAKSKLRSLSSDCNLLYTTTITLAELYRGAYLSKDTHKEVDKIQNLLGFVKLLTMDANSAKIFGELSVQLKTNMIGDADLFISSIVLSNNEVLLTKNLKHFERVPKLKFETW
jgi:tRNA(fMet)-specific endonuclease VapC